MVCNLEIIKGIFVTECKNRFISTVIVNDTLVECYVPSSSRIENYLNINESEVALTLNKGKKSRTKYSLFAVKNHKDYIILNLNKVNVFLENLIMDGELYPHNDYKVYREKIKEGYKSDLYLEGDDDSIIVEAKGVISNEQIVRFPQVSSKRSILQLKALEELLERGKRVHYYLVSLSPLIDKIEIDNDSEYYYHLKRCINKGLSLKGVSVVFDGESVLYGGMINISIK